MQLRRLIAPILAVVLLAGCGQIAPVPTPTPEPTATPMPTATPVPTPTMIPTPTPTPIPVGNTIRDALEQSAALTTYRLDLELNASGALGGINLGSAETEVIGLSGEFVGDDYQFQLRGFLASFLGADPDRGLQALRVGDQSYVRGPLLFLGAPDDAWYELTAEQSAIAAPPVSAESSVGVVADADADFSGFRRDGDELIGSQRCERFVGDEEATSDLLGSLSETGLPIDQQGDVEQAETRLWICPDGYLHRLELALSGAQPESEGGATYSYTLNVNLSGFDEDLAIEPPDNARPLPAGPISPAPSP